MLIHLNGWPGVGKLTVARALAGRMGARLVDNHTLHNVAISVCDRGTDAYWDVYYQVRKIAYDRIRAMPPDTVVVMTNALAADSAKELEAWGAVKKLAADRSDRLISVILECSAEENVRRVVREDRRHNRKLVDPTPLIQWRADLALLVDESVPTLRIDNTNRTPEDVAEEIEQFASR